MGQSLAVMRQAQTWATAEPSAGVVSVLGSAARPCGDVSRAQPRPLPLVVCGDQGSLPVASGALHVSPRLEPRCWETVGP